MNIEQLFKALKIYSGKLVLLSASCQLKILAQFMALRLSNFVHMMCLLLSIGGCGPWAYVYPHPCHGPIQHIVDLRIYHHGLAKSQRCWKHMMNVFSSAVRLSSSMSDVKELPANHQMKVNPSHGAFFENKHDVQQLQVEPYWFSFYVLYHCTHVYIYIYLFKY